MTPRQVLAAALLLGASQTAVADEFRQLTLTDGRVLTVKLQDTLDAGIAFEVPQGKVEVPFSDLIDMVPSDAAAYDSQDDWVVFVAAPESLRPAITQSISALPKVGLVGEAGTRPLLRPDSLEFAQACEGDLDCLVAATSDAQWLWLVSVTQEEDGTIQVRSRVNLGSEADVVVAPDESGLEAALWDALGVEPIRLEEPVADVSPPRVAGSGADWVPVPGYGALRSGDKQRAVKAMALALPMSIATVGIAGKTATRPGELALMGAGSYVVGALAINQALAQTSKSADLLVIPQASERQVGLTVNWTPRRK